MNGKDKCKILKQIRRDIAAQNDINLTIAECTHKGDCTGTCPRCEYEVRVLEKELADRRTLGKKITILGISASVLTSLTACKPVEAIREVLGIKPEITELEGDIAVPDTEAEGTMTVDELEGEPVIVEGDLRVDISEDGISVDTAVERLAGIMPFPEDDETADKAETIVNP